MGGIGFNEGGLNLEFWRFFTGFHPESARTNLNFGPILPGTTPKVSWRYFFGDVVGVVFFLAGCFRNVRFSANIGKWKAMLFLKQEDGLAGKRTHQMMRIKTDTPAEILDA